MHSNANVRFRTTSDKKTVQRLLVPWMSRAVGNFHKTVPFHTATSP